MKYLSKFKRAKRNWTQNYDRLKDKESILHGELEDMKIKRNDLEEIADDIFDNVDEDSDQYENMLAQINQVRSQMSFLYEKCRSSSPPSGSAPVPAASPHIVDADLIVEKEIKKLQSVLEFHQNEVENVVGFNLSLCS